MKLNEFGRTVRLGILGLGGRSLGQMDVLLNMPDVEITAVCDVYEDRVQAGIDKVVAAKGNTPKGFTNVDDCINCEDVEAVVVMTGWETHIPFAIKAMKAGKRVAMEVGGASSVDECWQLVHAYEETGVPVMLLENCCYGETELTLLKMIREGMFGTVVHCTGAYAHDLRDEIGNGDINRHYRQRHFMHRNGELYPTHELGPIATYLNINRGNRMVTLTAMASKACGLHEWMVQNRPDSPLVNAQFNEGDIVNTMIKCANGETIMLTHDCSLPRPYSRGGSVRGTKGCWMEENHSIFIDGVSPHDPSDWTHRWEPDEKYMEENRHPLWVQYHQEGVRGGHGGMDYLVLRAFIESVQKEIEPPIDVYDTAAWMAVTALSEESIALGSMPVPVPDFTSGRWCYNREPFLQHTFED